MFTIDLLKGQGIPAKSGPEGIAIAVATFTVPAIIAIAMFGYHWHTNIIASIQEQGIAIYETKINQLSDAVELQDTLGREKSDINNSLSDVSSAIGRYTQWSPILATLVKNMPDSMVLTKLEVKQISIKRKVPAKNDPKKMVDATVPVRTLQINICGNPQFRLASASYDETVRKFRNNLRSSTVLGPKLEHIKVSQQLGTLEKQDVVSYEIDCIFKPAL